MYLKSLTKFEDNRAGIRDAIDEFTSRHTLVTSLLSQPQRALQPRRHRPLDMPRKQNLSPSRLQYSRDLKQRVVYQAFTLMKSTTEIAINLDMPIRVVQRVLTNWREIGDVCKDQTRLGRAPLMSQSSVKACAGPCVVSAG